MARLPKSFDLGFTSAKRSPSRIHRLRLWTVRPFVSNRSTHVDIVFAVHRMPSNVRLGVVNSGAFAACITIKQKNSLNFERSDLFWAAQATLVPSSSKTSYN